MRQGVDKVSNRVLLGHILVNSGRVVLTDPLFMSSFEDNEFIEPDDEWDYSYSGAASAAFSEHRGGLIGPNLGVSCATGVDDPDDILYPVYQIRNAKGEILGLLVQFKQD